MKAAEDNFYIVAIGASAGGIEALLQFFASMPAEPGVAYVIIRHLKRDHPTIQKKLIQQEVEIPVVTVRGGEKVRRNTIYLMPENKKMIIRGRTLLLEERPEDEKINMAIDHFFRSLAQDVKEKAIGIIMSGLGSDGTKGAFDIESNNGIVLVQEPGQAQFNGMPNSVILFNHPDYVVCLQEMHNYIMSHIQDPKTSRFLKQEGKKSSAA